VSTRSKERKVVEVLLEGMDETKTCLLKKIC